MACPFSPPPGPRCCWRAVVRQLPWCAAIILPVLGSAAVAGNGCARADGMRRRTDDRSRPPWHRWYSPAAWTKLRSHQLTVEPLCRMCLAEGRTTAATIADHVTPPRGDPDLFCGGPFQSLCATCHSRFKQSQESGGNKHLYGCDANGEPLFYEW